MILPKLDYSGVVCVDFYYHMYGFHIKDLRLVQQSTTSTGQVSRTVWMRSRDMGNQWYHGNSELDISYDSQVRDIMSLWSVPTITSPGDSCRPAAVFDRVG